MKLKRKNELFSVAENRYQRDLDVISLMKSIQYIKIISKVLIRQNARLLMKF